MVRFLIEGNLVYTIPLSLMLLANLVLIGTAIYKKLVHHADTVRLCTVIHHVSLLALIWGVMGTVIGLFYVFGSLAQMEETLPLNVIMGGLRVAMITATYGMIIFVVSRLGLLFLKSWPKTSS